MSLFNRVPATKMRLVLHMNMLLGLLAVAIAVGLIITGEYANLTARQAAEAVLNRIAVGGLLYVVIFWLIDTFTKPFLVAVDHPLRR